MRNMFFLFALAILAGLGCSQSAAPTLPSTPEANASPVSTRTVWGMYDVYFNTETLEIQAVPARAAEFRMNVNNFMNANPALLTLQITDASKLKTTGEVTLNVSLTHPVNKPKLAGFDVHCVLLSNGPYWLNYDDTLTYPAEGTNTYLMNADGWTRWYNAKEFKTPGLFGYVPGKLGNLPNPSATLNAYKLYADGLSATADAAAWLAANQTNRAIFTPGSTNTRQWIIKFPLSGGKPVIKYQYVVVASWAAPSKDNPSPADFPPEANIQEASAIRIDTTDSTLYYTPTKWGGNLVVHADIFDWQGGNNIAGQISRIIIESNCLASPSITTDPVLEQSSGSPFGTFSITLPADELTSTDPVTVWVIVESKAPTTYLNVPTSSYPENAKLAAFNRSKALVNDEAPPEPPQIISGIDIVSGTTQCPDRTTDNNAVLGVVATGGLPLTYSWTVFEVKGGGGSGQAVPGYNKVPGDGAGHLNIDFTSSAFQGITEYLRVSCVVSDGVNPDVTAQSLQLYLDCIVFHADLNTIGHPDNKGWALTDFSPAGTTWFPFGKTGGPNLKGTGALWQDDPDLGGGVSPNSKTLLLSPPIIVPSFLSDGQVKIVHSYSFNAFSMGGNVKLGPLGTIVSVTQAAKPISSGHGYDGALTDSTNPMYPQQVFSAPGVSGLYTSTIQLGSSLIGMPIQIGFAAASGGSAYANGGWLIDDVTIIGIL